MKSIISLFAGAALLMAALVAAPLPGRAGSLSEDVEPQIATRGADTRVDGIDGAGCPAGAWAGSVPLEDGSTVLLVVDIGFVGSRCAGEFDVMDWGVENYPVEVVPADSTVQLLFAGANADFAGTLSGDSLLTGTIRFAEQQLPLTLRRTGDARFSENFLALERAADDSSVVERLSSNGEELRRRFNADSGKTRLLMLLSPT